jgi:hypothetical protein
VTTSEVKKKLTMNGHLWPVIVAVAVSAIITFLTTKALSPSVSPDEMATEIAKVNLEWKDAISKITQQQKENVATITKEVDKLHPIIDNLRESINKDTNDRLARHDVLIEFCVEELRKGGRFTNEDGIRLEERLNNHNNIPAHPNALERIQHLENAVDKLLENKNG